MREYGLNQMESDYRQILAALFCLFPGEFLWPICVELTRTMALTLCTIGDIINVDKHSTFIRSIC